MDFEPASRPADVPAWDSLDGDQQDVQELMMAAFAGMVDRLDQNIGRVIQTLKNTGRYENTLILFLSDNGACPFQRTTKKTLEQKLMPWDPESYYTYDKGWAHACNTPFREYKRDQHEGGINTPFIAHWPAGIAKPGTTYHGQAHLVDLMATFLDLADTAYPSERNGTKVGPARGKTLTPIFKTGSRPPRGPIHFTFYGQHNALRDGDWKLVNINSGPWELYNLAEDRTELSNLASKEPARLATMIEQWEAMAKETGVPKPKKKKAKN
jgi:arylsulfatase